MKKKVLIIVGITIFCIVGFKSFIYWLSNTPCDPPEKPNNVPKAVVWKGGCDGGNWIELVSFKREKIRLRVYRDWNGEMIIDADFEYKDCKNFNLTEENWHNCIGNYANGYIGISSTCNEIIKCRLEPIIPVYYEESLE